MRLSLLTSMSGCGGWRKQIYLLSGEGKVSVQFKFFSLFPIAESSLAIHTECHLEIDNRNLSASK